MAYELSFAGVPFTLATAEVEEWINRWIPHHDIQNTYPPELWPGSGLHGPMCVPPAAARLNELWWPAMAQRWSIFRGLATRAQAAEMVKRSKLNSLVKNDNRLVMHLDDETQPSRQQRIEAEMQILPPIPIKPLNSPAEEQYYLVTLVCDRFINRHRGWTFKPGTRNWADHRGYVAPYQFFEPDASAPVFESVYLSVGTNSAFFAAGFRASMAADMAAHNTGRTLVMPLVRLPGFSTKHMICKRWDAADLSGSFGNTPIAGGKPFDALSSQRFVIPSAFRLSVPRYNTTTGQMADQGSRNFLRQGYGGQSGIDFYLVWQVTVNTTSMSEFNAFGRNSWVEVDFRSQVEAQAVDFATTPTNATAISDLCTQLAKDWIYRNIRGIDAVFEGIVPMTTPPFGCDVLFCYSLKRPITRITRIGWQMDVTEFQHGSLGQWV